MPFSLATHFRSQCSVCLPVLMGRVFPRMPPDVHRNCSHEDYGSSLPEGRCRRTSEKKEHRTDTGNPNRYPLSAGPIPHRSHRLPPTEARKLTDIKLSQYQFAGSVSV